jgi:hypothetical protein
MNLGRCYRVWRLVGGFERAWRIAHLFWFYSETILIEEKEERSEETNLGGESEAYLSKKHFTKYCLLTIIVLPLNVKEQIVSL